MCLEFESIPTLICIDDFDLWDRSIVRAGVRSCYDEGKRTAETLTMDYHRGANLEVRVHAGATT